MRVRTKLQATDRPTAYQDALGRLNRRDHSEQELRRELLRRGHAKTEVESALLRLRERRYLDDPRLAARFAHSQLAHRGLGRQRIRAGLRQRGLKPTAIEDGLREALCEVSEAEALERQARKYWRARAADEPRRRLRKLWAFLLRRGFPAALITERLGALWPEWADAAFGLEEDLEDLEDLKDLKDCAATESDERGSEAEGPTKRQEREH